MHKNKSSETYEYQLQDLDDHLIENNHEECSYPSKTKLMISEETMQSRKEIKIL